MKLGIPVLDLIIFLQIFIFIYVCPYTKVEESFNIQAIHDLIYNSKNLTNFDHLEFPGVVPRTFVAPVVVSTILKPFLILGGSLFDKISCLFLARILLGIISVFFQAKFRNSVAAKYGQAYATAYGLISLCQFHLAFYMSRTLPNTFALILAFLAFTYWIEYKPFKMFFILGVTASLFRSELFALILPLALYFTFSGKINTFLGAFVGILSIIFGAWLSLIVDTFFWNRVVWAEGEVFYFNTILNKSHLWGTTPFHWYFTNALPRALLGALVFIPFGIYKFKAKFFCAVAFIALYSYLPHKELRFIFYSIPLFNLVAAGGIVYLYEKRYKILQFLIGIVLISSFFVTFIFLISSSKNYYGAEAINRLYSIHNNSSDQYFHMDHDITMNGVSRFLEKPGWRYSKKEEYHDFTQYQYLLTGNKNRHKNNFELVEEIHGFHKIQLRPLKFLTEPKVYILKRKPNNETHNPASVIYWYQNKEETHLTFNLVNVENETISSDEYSLNFSGVSRGQKYQNELIFNDYIDPNVNINKFTRYLKIEIKKKKPKLWKRLMIGKFIPQWLKIDWDHTMEYQEEKNNQSVTPKHIPINYPKIFSFLNEFRNIFRPLEFSIMITAFLFGMCFLFSSDKEKLE